MAVKVDAIGRYRLASRARSLLCRPDREARLTTIADEAGIAVNTLRGDCHVPGILTEEEVRGELSQSCANGRARSWSHFVALGPLADMPREKGNRLALEFLHRARQGNLGARWLADQARRALQQHKDGVLEGFADGADRGHDEGDPDELRAEVADLRREIRELRQVVDLGHARTPTDDDRCSPGVPGRPDGPAAHAAPGAGPDVAGGTSS